jgi:hypothetical protein
VAIDGKIRSALVFSLVFFAGLCLQAQVQQKVLPSTEERSKPQINALTDCGARGDGVNDDGPSLQKCIATHPSTTILLPKSTRNGDCDYKLSQTLSFDAYSTALSGVGGTANNNTTLCWTADITGININGGQGQALRNLNLRGNSGFNPVKVETYTVGTADGLRISGGQVSLRDIYVSNFSRHGVDVDSTLGGNGDIWLFENVRSEGNRGDGFHFSGQDANAGLCLLCISRLNQGWGFYNNAVIPSTYVAPLTDGNHNDPTKPKQTVQIAQITVANRVATITSITPHQSIAGDWGVIQGCQQFNNKWAVVSVPSPTTLQINTTNPDGIYCNTNSATYGFQAGARLWASGRTVNDATTRNGSYNVTSVSAHWTQNDYGTLVCVVGAGSDGKELCSTIKLITGNIAVLADAASSNVQGGRARIVTNGGPYNAKNSTFLQSYAEGDQEGLSQLVNSLTLGEDWGVGANQEIENFIVNNGYASPLKFTRRNLFGGYSHSIFQAGRAYGTGSIARDPSYEGFWNVQETDNLGTVLSTLSFRHSNVTGTSASGWNCFSENPPSDGAALSMSSICLPDIKTRAIMSGGLIPTQLPMFPAGGFWVKGSVVQDAATGTSGLRQIRYDVTDAPKTCNAGDIFYKMSPTSGSYIGWVCPAANISLPFGGIGSSKESVFGEKVPAPRSAGAECSIGQWAADTSFYYVCTAKNTWRRAALNTW